MPVFKYRDPETGEWISVGGGGSSTEDIVISKEDPVNVDIWIDPDEEADESGSSGSGIAIGKEEPTGDEEVWIDTDDEAGEYYTKEEVDQKLEEIPLGVTMTLLWENPDSTATFAAQAIALDLSQYDGVYVSAINNGNYHADGYGVIVNSGIVFKGIHGLLMHFEGDNAETYRLILSRRVFTVKETGISFDSAYYGRTDTYVSASNILIPYQIYGIKGVQ